MAIQPNPLAPPIPLNKRGLINSFDRTNLDLENPNALGGPNKDLQTQYPATSTGTPTLAANPGPTTRFIPRYTPSSTYLDNVDGRLVNHSLLSSNAEEPGVLRASSLDNTNSQAGGEYKDTNDPTVYPVSTLGSSPSDIGFSTVPGKPASKFSGQFNSESTYLQAIKPYL